MDSPLLLALLIFVAALLYSSVGHGGASGYLAAMALLSVAPQVMKPTALVLNVLVAGIATARFYQAGYFQRSLWWPFAVGSIPLAYVGGAMNLQTHAFKIVLGVALLLAAGRFIFTLPRPAEEPQRRPPLWLALPMGAALGFVAGLTGIGGGVFLSPILLFMGWAGVRHTAAVSAAFILVNSIAGLAGNYQSAAQLPPTLAWLAFAAVAGGLIGSDLGSKRLPPRALRTLLAVVLIAAGAKLVFESATAPPTAPGDRREDRQRPREEADDRQQAPASGSLGQERAAAPLRPGSSPLAMMRAQEHDGSDQDDRRHPQDEVLPSANEVGIKNARGHQAQKE